jgi:hypothetical protein
MGNGNYGKIRLLQDVNTDLGDRSPVHTIFISIENKIFLTWCSGGSLLQAAAPLRS